MPLKDDPATSRTTEASEPDSDTMLSVAKQRTRLHILRLLAQSGATGMTVSELTARSNVVRSTVINHLERLRQVGAIRRQREEGGVTRQWLTEAAKTALADLLAPPVE